MTTLMIHPRRESSLPSFDEHDFVVTGQPMGAMVRCIIQARTEFLGSGMQCRFWESVVESQLADLELTEYIWLNDGNIRQDDVTLASEYLDAALRLEPTRLPAWDD